MWLSFRVCFICSLSLTVSSIFFLAVYVWFDLVAISTYNSDNLKGKLSLWSPNFNSYFVLVAKLKKRKKYYVCFDRRYYHKVHNQSYPLLISVLNFGLGSLSPNQKVGFRLIYSNRFLCAAVRWLGGLCGKKKKNQLT